jgi:hypothetical protein
VTRCADHGSQRLCANQRITALLKLVHGNRAPGAEDERDRVGPVRWHSSSPAGSGARAAPVDEKEHSTRTTATTTPLGRSEKKPIKWTFAGRRASMPLTLRPFAPETVAAQPTQRVPRTTKNDGLPYRRGIAPSDQAKVSGIVVGDLRHDAGGGRHRISDGKLRLQGRIGIEAFLQSR